MPNDIAGYVDRSKIKGQYYKYAAGPEPILGNSSINIDTISDAIIAKSIYANSGQISGTLPGIGSYLIVTTAYGNSTYLQTAIDVNNGYEYKRIKANESDWTEWKDNSISGSISTDLKNMSDRIEDCETNSSKALNAVDSLTDTDGAVTAANKNASAAYSLADQVNSRVTTLNQRLAPLGSKIAVVEQRINSAGMTKSGEWYVSAEIDVDISSYGFTNVVAIFPGYGKDFDDPATGAGIPIIRTITDRVFSFRIGSYADTTIKKRTYKFLILGT